MAVLLVLGWAAFCAWCVHGFPPAVDLPAHAAQIQTLADVLRGRGAATYYDWHVPIGYGLTTWLGVPLAVIWNGAIAARVLFWFSIFTLPLAHALLARALGRSGWVAVLSAPCAFNLSYWFGFLPTVFAWPWVLLGWALFVQSRAAVRRPRALAVVAIVGVVVMQSHLVAFAAFALGIAVLALAEKPWRIADAMAALAPPTLLCATQVLGLVTRAVHPGDRLASSYDLVSHFRWTLWHYGSDQRAIAWVGALTAAAFIVFALLRKNASRAAVGLTVAMAALYLATPMAISGAWLVHPRFVVLIVLAALLLVDVRALPRAVAAGAAGAAVLALVAVLHFERSFAHDIDGLEALVSQPVPEGPVGGMSLEGLSLPHQRIRFLEHLPEWWCATQGGVGNHFFADADHQAVQFAGDQRLPAVLTPDTPERLAPFQSLLILGDGPLPPSLAEFHLAARAGHWRRVDRDRPTPVSAVGK